MSNKSLSAFMRPNVQQIENAKYAASPPLPGGGGPHGEGSLTPNP